MAVVLLCAVSIGAALPSATQAARHLLFGFNDNLPMVLGSDAATRERSLGAGGVSYTLLWQPGKDALDSEESNQLSQGIESAAGMRVILSIRTTGGSAPIDDAQRDQFCTYARNAVASFPSINDVVIGNEPNSSYFWRPQYNPDGTSAAPAAYEALLARCYDVLHDFRPGINVAAPATGPMGNDNPNAISNVSHSPTSFILKLADAYRGSGRAGRIFDTVVHHPYGNSNDERPYLMHPKAYSIGEGDWNRLVDTYQAAFAGTAQPVPGRCLADSPCVPIWYLEIGFQTSVPGVIPLYYGAENVRTVPEISRGETTSPSPPATSAAPDQATQLAYALRLAYCQPYVDAVFNFLIRDDPNLAGYQSGLFWADWSEKGSYWSLRSQVADLAANRVSCAAPTAPSGLTARVSGGEVDLAWCGSSSSIGVSGYTIYRRGAPIGTTTGLTYADANAGPGTTGSYSIRAYDAAGGTSDPSATVVPSTSAQPPPSCARPLLPGSFRAASSSPRALNNKHRAGCVVPNVRGKQLRKAARLLARHKCRLGRVRHVRTKLKRRGIVSQSPRAGAHLRSGGRVNVTLSRRRSS